MVFHLVEQRAVTISDVYCFVPVLVITINAWSIWYTCYHSCLKDLCCCESYGLADGLARWKGRSEAPKMSYVDVHLVLWHPLGHFFLPLKLDSSMLFNSIPEQRALAATLRWSAYSCHFACAVSSTHHTLLGAVSIHQLCTSVFLGWWSEPAHRGEQVWALPPLFRVNQPLDRLSWIT